MHSLKKTARLSGGLYLIWALTGIYGMVYVPSQTLVAGDAIATANKLLSNEFIFRTGIINDLLSTTVCIFLLIALYNLFERVDKNVSLVMVLLLFVTIPVSFIMDGLSIASLMLFKGEILTTFELGQRQELAMLFFKINYYLSLTLEMFWGLWLFPFGYLVYRSGFIPRLLGIFLILNGFAYVIPSIVSILIPAYRADTTLVAMPFLILGEISITLWLVIKGVKKDIKPIEA